MLNFPQIWHYVIVSDNKLRIQFTKSFGLPTPSHSLLFGIETVQDEKNIFQKIFFKPAFMQTVQDEKWVIYCPSILKMAGLPPLNSYVYISYQAKHALNFARKNIRGANFSDIR